VVAVLLGAAAVSANTCSGCAQPIKPGDPAVDRYADDVYLHGVPCGEPALKIAAIYLKRRYKSVTSKIECKYCTGGITSVDGCVEIIKHAKSSIYYHHDDSHKYCTKTVEDVSLVRILPNGGSCTECGFTGGSIQGHREFQITNSFRCCDSAKNAEVHVGDEKEHDFKRCDPEKWNGNPNRNSKCGGFKNKNCWVDLDDVEPVYEQSGSPLNNGTIPKWYYHNKVCFERASKVRTYAPGEHPEFWNCQFQRCSSKPITNQDRFLVRDGLRYHCKGMYPCLPDRPREYCKKSKNKQAIETSIKANGSFEPRNKSWKIYEAGKHPHFNDRRRRLTGIEKRFRQQGLLQ